jgi:hypothetical protein
MRFIGGGVRSEVLAVEGAGGVGGVHLVGVEFVDFGHEFLYGVGLGLDFKLESVYLFFEPRVLLLSLGQLRDELVSLHMLGVG